MSMVKTFLCAAALGLAATAAAAQQTKPVTIVLSHATMAVGEEVFLYAVPKALGYFKQEGLEVTIQGASGGVQAGQVMASGKAQFITTLAEGILQMREQGANALAILSLKQYNGYSVGVVPDSPIKSLADLKGKTIGFPVSGGGTVIMLNESLKEIDMKPDYQSIVIGWGPGAAVAMQQKRVDAAVLWDAAYGLLENIGTKLRYIDLPIQNKIAGFTLASNDAFVKEHPDQVEGFCRAVVKGLAYTLANKKAAIKLFFQEFPTTKPSDVSEDVAVAQSVNVLDKWLEAALKGLPPGGKYGAFEKERWDLSKKLYTESGALKGTVPVEQAFTTQFFEGCNRFDRAAIEAQAKASN